MSFRRQLLIGIAIPIVLFVLPLAVAQVYIFWLDAKKMFFRTSLGRRIEWKRLREEEERLRWQQRRRSK